ncbi:MAG: hypothetical protein HY865_22005 [Chloroflexi bacterium]|nr:hypothetical protein [Chloroflexota bacterium]
MSHHTKKTPLYRIGKKIRSYFFLEQWIVLVAPNVGYKSLSWKAFKPLFPPLDRFWADPFVLARDNKYYVFIEELLYSTNLGRIVCLALDRDLNILSNQVVLERPYHLSYPFVFEHGGQLYMMPETKRNNAIELYRCTHFPDRWEFEKTLISDIRAVDATLLNYQDKWWLFASIDSEAGSTWDTLHIFHADHPTSDQWTPHPLNPVIKDVTSARPAGCIFWENGSLIRPSQDCSVRYGYATNFNRITKLTETEYAETRVHRFEPSGKDEVLSAHTFNGASGLTVIDAEQLRPRFWA